MFQRDAFLEKVHISNFLSFNDTELPLKPLTVLVGPNASGKSNVLEVLHLLNRSMVHGQFPDILAAPDPSENVPIRINFQFASKVKETPAIYDLALESVTNDVVVDAESSITGDEYLPMQIVEEGLMVNDVKVIATMNGQFILRDEDGKNETTYKPDTLALKAAGDYGFKPITSALAEFIKGWQFQDFEPKLGRGHLPRPMYKMDRFPSSGDFRNRENLSSLSSLLLDWYDNDSARFNEVNQSLEAATDFKIGTRSFQGIRELCILEGDDKARTFETASDGTLRLITYYVILNNPQPPPLIAIEEPEQNLHPGALANIADFLEQLAERSQVIITTHSSQLLDAFDPEKLSDSLGILLLRNPLGRGTEVINLEDIRGKREALDGWITDFGIGSAIFHSQLLPGPVEESE